MIKPQEKYEGIFIKSQYPEKAFYYYNGLKENLTEIQVEDMNALIEEIYKAAYVDGFKDALFFTNNYF